MPTTNIGMYAAGTGGTEDSAATIDIPQDGVITGVQVAHYAALDADGDVSSIELSFIGSNQKSVNDTRSILALSRIRGVGTAASGAHTPAANFFVPLDIDVSGGERLHLHIDATAGVTSVANFIIQLTTGRRIPRRSARR